MALTRILSILLIFVLGWLASCAYALFSHQGLEWPFSLVAPEQNSPQDWIKESQIKVLQDRVIIDVQGASWARFADTNSMDPLFDSGANSIEIKPKSPADLKIGDIVSYESKQLGGIIIHRIVDIGHDEQGIYYILKGDNNLLPDPEKVRFEQIKGVLVAIIY